MRQRSLIAITATLAAGALTLTACGSRDEDGGSDSGSGGTTVTIGVDAPLTGDLSALGLGIKNSVDLAAKQANEQKYVDGITFKIEALDDQALPSSGQQNATKLVADKAVLGVVGPLNSSVAESMQKIFDDAKLVEVSPANTNPALTQGTEWNGGTKARPYKSYFRTATTDAIQGPFAAQYVYNDSKKKKVFVIDDKKTYGAGLAATFTEEFKKLGGAVVGTQHIDPDTKDFSAVATQVKSSGADVVYYGGEYPQARSASRSRPRAPRSRSSAATASTAPTSSSWPVTAPPATSPPRSARRSRSSPPPRSSSPTTRPRATRRPTRRTAATPTTPPGRSSSP